MFIHLFQAFIKFTCCCKYLPKEMMALVMYDSKLTAHPKGLLDTLGLKVILCHTHMHKDTPPAPFNKTYTCAPLSGCRLARAHDATMALEFISLSLRKTSIMSVLVPQTRVSLG